MQGKTILVAEDSSLIRRLIVTALRPLECTVIEACDGAEAISLADEHNPDLVLLDVVMPKVDGYSVLETLRSREGCQDCLIVMLTAAGSDDDLQRGRDAGADAHIVKPFESVVLRQTIEGLLER